MTGDPEANIYPLHMPPQYYLNRRWRELKTEFLPATWTMFS
jgi:hypothetical protein